MKVEVGQKVWLVKKKFRGDDEDPTEETVSKVGRKYFELLSQRSKYSIQSGIEEVDSNYRDKVYETIQEIKDGIEHSSLTSKIQKAFSGYGKLPFSLDQLRQIYKIINP